MQKSLLTTMLLSGALAAGAATPQLSTIGTATPASVLAQTTTAKAPVRATQSKTINDKHVRLLEFQDANIRKLNVPARNKAVNPMLKKARAAQENQNGVLLFESFENPTDDTAWLPEGWTQVSYTDESLELPDMCNWHTTMGGGLFLPSAPDGDWMASVCFTSQDPTAEMDEWLISPEVSMPEGDYDLTFDAYMAPVFFFNMDNDHVDWNAFEFIEQEVAYTLQVLVSADGGEFEVVRDFAPEYMGESMWDLVEIDEVQSHTISLAEFGGKTIKVAFRMVGHDCNSQFLDAVKIALPSLDLDIAPDYGVQYYGTSSNTTFSSLTTGVALFPVYAPFQFYNFSYNEGAEYTWHYTDPQTFEWTTAPDEEEALTLTYEPDYSTDFSKTNNLVYAPYLSATAPGFADTEYSIPGLTYLQAGGTPSWPNGDELITMGVVPFNVSASKLGDYTVDYPEAGDSQVPVFGHNASTDSWWTDYTFHGENAEGDFARVDAILNFIYTIPGSSLVFDKVWLHAVGTFEADVEFTCGIYAIDPDTYEPAKEPIVTTTITGADAEIEPYGTFNLVSLVFDFSEPVVLDGDKSCYIVKISGFNSDKVEYFSPFQQWRPGDLALGWLEKTISWNGVTGTSYSPIAYLENEYGEMYCAFDIELGAWYPWLDAEEQTVELGDGCGGTIKLATYYDGADLTVTAPDWIEATASGRYDECEVTVTATSAEAAREGFVTVSAPGVETKTFKVTQDVSGLSSVAAADRQVKTVFTPAGVAADLSAPGIYVVTYTDGTVEKKVIK